MDLSAIGNIGAYTKQLKLQTKWEAKRKSGDVTGHGSPVDDWLGKSSAASDPAEQERGSKKLSEILQKVYAGGKLTRDEEAYLQSKDPVTWQKLKDIDRDQKSYEQELKRCKTREDVQRLKASRMGASLSAVKSIENDPNIPQEKKLQMAQLENRRCGKLEASTRAFVKSGAYRDLPTEAEKAKAEREQREAEEARREQGPEEPKAPETAEAGPETEKAEDAPKPETVQKEEKPAVQSESQEARKVRRAKARAAYAAARDADGGETETLDIQA